MAGIAVVTGASGYVASQVVRELLEIGYHVHATVRSTKDLSKVEHLQKLAAALPGELTFFEGDLLKPGTLCFQVSRKFLVHNRIYGEPAGFQPLHVNGLAPEILSGWALAFFT